MNAVCQRVLDCVSSFIDTSKYFLKRFVRVMPGPGDGDLRENNLGTSQQ